MKNNNSFVAYEYKNVTVKRDTATIYTDCLENFGWELLENDGYEMGGLLSNLNPVNLGANIANAAHSFGETGSISEPVTLRFRRDRRIENKTEIDKLERRCEDALSAISGMERKSNAKAMGISLGAGIVGTAILAFAVNSFRSSNIVAGVLFTVVGVAGWGIGYLANRKIARKKSAQSEPMIRAQLDAAYSACEQAHALLVS